LSGALYQEVIIETDARIHENSDQLGWRDSHGLVWFFPPQREGTSQFDAKWTCRSFDSELPLREDFMQLRNDWGYSAENPGSFHLDVLSELGSNWAWSSTNAPDSPGFFTIFSGEDGSFGNAPDGYIVPTVMTLCVTRSQ
jgi:hypothetical protein